MLIIGMMFIRNQLVFMSFHPVAYTVKLNIEMTMANLIRKLATSRENDFRGDHSHTHSYAMPNTGGAGGTLTHSSAYRGTRTSCVGVSQVGVGDAKGKLSDDERRIVVTEEYEICHV